MKTPLFRLPSSTFFLVLHRALFPVRVVDHLVRRGAVVNILHNVGANISPNGSFQLFLDWLVLRQSLFELAASFFFFFPCFFRFSLWRGFSFRTLHSKQKFIFQNDPPHDIDLASDCDAQRRLPTSQPPPQDLQLLH